MKIFNRIKTRKGNIEFKLMGKSYKINSLPISSYYEIMKNTEDTLGNKARTISILSGAPPTDLLQLELNQFEALWGLVLNNYLSYNKDYRVRKEIIVRGTKYKLVNIKKFTVGEYSDMELLNMSKNALHHQIAIIYRLPGEQYDSQTVMDRMEDFKDVDIRDIMGALNFFLILSKTSINRFLLFIRWKIKDKNLKQMISQLHITLKNQEKSGMDLSTFFQGEIYTNLIKHLTSQLKKPLILSSTQINETKN